MTQVTQTDSSTDLSGKVQETAEGAKQAIQDVAGQAQQTVKSQIDQRSTQAGDTASSVAQAVRNAGGELRNQGQDLPAKIIEQAADRAEQLGSYLRDSNADTILRDVEDFGRKQPWAVILGGVIAGFAASRFLKASSSRRYEQRGSSNGSSFRSQSALTSDTTYSPVSGAPYPPGGGFDAMPAPGYTTPPPSPYGQDRR